MFLNIFSREARRSFLGFIRVNERILREKREEFLILQGKKIEY